MMPKSRFVGVRLEPGQRHKLLVFAVLAGQPGNLSAGMRWALEHAQPGNDEVPDAIDQGAGSWRNDEKEQASYVR